MSLNEGRFAAVLSGLLLCGAVAAQPAPEGAPATPSASTEMVPLVRVVPRYPREAARAGISGYVEFDVVVSPDGTVKEVRLLKSEPGRVFVQAARDSLMRWRFQPREVDGKAVEYTGTQRITFNLEPEGQTNARMACEAAREPKREPMSMSGRVQQRVEGVVAALKDSQYAKAEELARRVVEDARTPFERAFAHQMLGGALAGLNRRDEAIAAYEAALATQALPWTLHDQVQFNIAQMHAGAGRAEQALRILEQYLKESCAPSPQAREQYAKLLDPAAKTPLPADPPR